jgi:spore germination cell wall hydrolase CwlJ-like protein
MFRFILTVIFCAWISGTEKEIPLVFHFVNPIVNQQVAVNPKDVDCLAKTIYHEAGNQSLEGKKAIASVIFNRSHQKNKSICDVVYQKKQFTFTHKRDKSIPERFRADYHHLAESILTIYNADKWIDNVNGATFFHPKWTKAPWRKSKDVVRVAVIGEHIFYKNIKENNEYN